MRILITGSQGFVGRYFHNSLLGHDIVSIDLIDRGYPQGSQFIKGDCRQFFAQDTTQFDLVIHLAAIVGGRLTIENEPLAVATDLSVDAEMFNWAAKTKPHRVIYFSSSAAYPIELQTQAYRLKESDIDLANIKNPDMTYGWAKLTGEMLAGFAREKYGLNVAVFRPFSGYGSDQDPSYPFPAFIDRALRRDDPFEVWGDGQQVRDFIHMEDVVEAALVFSLFDIETPVNLGTGRATNFLGLAQMVTTQAGYNPEIRTREDRPVGVSYRCGDPTQMFKTYKPKITLEEGIERALLDRKHK